MGRVLLVVEDYSQLVLIEGTLKKIGMDVLGLKTEHSLENHLMTFSPDLIFLTAFGKKSEGISNH